MSDILAALGRWATVQGDAVAFSDAAGDITFAQLAHRVAGAALLLPVNSGPVGLLAASSIDWLVCDLAGWFAGVSIVPLPPFFADEQLAHVIADAGIGVVIADAAQAPRAARLGVAVLAPPRQEAPWRSWPMAGERIVYTSGSTGRPKGVRLGPAQIMQTCDALLHASGALADDRHLSVLPYALLLEAICGIYLPVLAGGHCRIAAEVVAASGADIAVRLGEALERHRPTTTVLVPQLLQGLVMTAQVGRVAIPDSLRFVAVGGAAVPPALAEQAWSLGIPVHEGYGLTECGSVVAVNTPGWRRAGSVGRPLPGTDVSIAPDGEIVVRSASVCLGYCNGAATAPPGLWHTGDLGRLDDDGYLHVLGRRDNLIVTANGRNIAPEWIETMLLADPRIGRCVVLPAAGGLGTVIEPSLLGAAWFGRADATRRQALVETLAAAAPAYARPHRLLVLAPGALAEAGLLTGNGRPRRRAIADRYAPDFANLANPTEQPYVLL